MIKKILFPLFSIFLVYRSLELVKFISHQEPLQFSGLEIGLHSVLLNVFITGIFAFLGFAFMTSRVMPNSYYWITNSRIWTSAYKVLGVTYFRYVLLVLFWGKDKNRKKYFNGTSSGLEDFDLQTRQAEFGHLGSFLTVLGVSCYLQVKGHTLLFISTMMINVFLNLYPIILQRINRIQIDRITHSIQRRKKNS